MRKSSVLTLVLLLVNLICIAQSDYQKGFIVTVESDTVRGLISSKKNEKSFTSCVFKKDDGVTEFSTQQLAGFGFDDGRFFVSEIEDGFFIEALVLGEMSLYRSNFDFFVRKEGKIHRFKSKRVDVESTGEKTVTVDKKWRGTMSFLISDCIADPSKATRGIDLSEKHLTKLIVEYNNCREVDYVVFKEDLEFTKTELGFSVGLANSTLQIHHFTPDRVFTHLPNSYKSSDLIFGVVLDVSSPRVNENTAFQGEINLIKASYYDQVITGPDFAPVTHDTYIDLTTLSFPFSLRYIVHQNSGLYFQAGLNVDINLNRETRHESTNLGPRNVNTAFDISGAQIGYWGGLGVKTAVAGVKSALSIKYFQVTHLNSERGFRGKNSRLVFGLTIFK